MYVKLSPTETLNRIALDSDTLDAATDREAWLLPFVGRCGNHQFLHRFYNNKIYIEPKFRFGKAGCGVQISAEPVLYGTKLVGRLVLAPKRRIFFTLWFGLVGMVLIGTAISISREIAGGKPLDAGFLAILVPTGMLIFGYLIIYIKKRSYQPQITEVRNWLLHLYVDSRFNGRDF
jgi:hypothetical protein